MHISIRQKFSLVFVSLILLPALILAFATYRRVQSSMTEQVEQEQLVLLRAIKANVVDRHVEDMENALRALSQDRALPEIVEDPDARERVVDRWELTRSLFPERSWIYFGTPENEIVVSPEWEPPDGYDLRTRPWYRQARYANGIVWVDPYAEYVTGSFVMSAAAPIYDDTHTFRGVLSVDTHLKGFVRLMKQDAGKRPPQVVAVSERGVTHMLNEKEGGRFDMARLPEWEDMSRINNDGRYLDYDGRTYFATFVNVPKLRLKLISLVPAEILHRDIYPILWTIVSVVATFIAVSLIAELYLSKHFIGNIERLNHYMQAVESGDYHIRYCVSGRDEFLQLNSRLNTMVHHLAKSIESLEIESNTDPLCGIPNRRYLMERLNEHVESRSEYGPGSSIVLLDIDHFKDINDTFGHAIGDEVLRRIARIMRSTFPEEAIVGRYGGEEFMAILPEVSTGEALSHAERFRAALEALAWRERDLVVTVSGGVADLDYDDRPDRVIHRADQALYRAKKEGRNRIVGG